MPSGGWPAVGRSLTHDSMITNGAVATLAVVLISIQSLSALRHAFYESFVHLHILLVIVTLAFLWLHLEGFPQLYYLFAAISAWACMRLLRVVAFLRANIGQQRTKAIIEVLPGDALRVSIIPARRIHTRPGSHLYLYIPSVGLWTSHPFSVAWDDLEQPQLQRNASTATTSSTSSSITLRKPPTPAYHPDPDPRSRQTLSTIIRRRTGFTNALYRRAWRAGGFKLTINAFIEPGSSLSHSVLFSCGTVLLFAGGVGIAHQLPFVRHLVQGYVAGTVAARRVVLVWATQDPEHLEWIRPWMTEILAMEGRRKVLIIKIYITQPTESKDISSPSSTVQMYVAYLPPSALTLETSPPRYLPTPSPSSYSPRPTHRGRVTDRARKSGSPAAQTSQR